MTITSTVNEEIASSRAAAASAQTAALTKLDTASAISEAAATEVFSSLASWRLPLDTFYGTPDRRSESNDISAGFNTDYNANLTSIEAWIKGQMTGWMETYYPRLNTALVAAEDAWLLSVVNNGYNGIPAALDNAIWQRARAKELVEGVRLEEEAIMQFSSRGFSLPLGVLADRLLQVQQDAANKSSTIARDQAIKQIELAADMVKFAIGEITKLRVAMARALADYITAWLSLPQAAADFAKAKNDFYKLSWDADAAYLNAYANWTSGVNVSREIQNQKAEMEVAIENAKMQNVATNRTVDTAVKAADMLAAQAAAALGAQNTLVGAISTATSSS